MLAPNTLLQNRYLIVRPIGHGGMGAIYLARDERLGHTVALKETFFSDERMRKAFEREARLLAHLRHPALPKVTDHFTEDGGQFIVMEFISGDDLQVLLAERGRPFGIEQVLSWADDLLKALDYLHKQDPPILHRDIKPANLKLTQQDEIILLDFGLAKGTTGQTSSIMTSKSVFGFTPNFAPLEQIQGTGTGPRSDLYSLAATLYYLMTGVIPPDALTRITEVANGKPDPLRRADEINSNIPQSVADILMKTMAHNRDHRPATATEMRQSLREAAQSLVAADALESKTSADRKKQLAMSSTLIEPTGNATVAAETDASPVPAPSTLKLSKWKTEPQDSTLRTTPERRVGRMPWVFAGLAVLLLVGVTIAIVSNSGSKPSAASQVQQRASKDESLTAAPTSVVTESPLAAPDDSEITTTTDASGTVIKTRIFKSNRRVAQVVVTTRDGKQTARVSSTQGEERDLPPDKVATALDVPGDLLADEVGFIKEKGTAAEQKASNQKSATPAKSPDRRTTTGAKTSAPVTGGSMIDRAMNGQSNSTPQSKSPANAQQGEQKTSSPKSQINQAPSKNETQNRAANPVKN
ncbi:MAG: eukaryotic-like serine/threonine-protein kinase [Acidobacteriota bacterium]|jgi:serine/threonine protein kinase|nr:eukaryotic-like serine/threonine-protein kinase [Acidobacteriota bacterium]